MSEQHLTQDENIIIAYLYDELDESSRLAFEQRLKNDPIFCQLYNQQAQVESLMQRGTRPVVSDERAEAMRWSLQRRLRKEVLAQDSSNSWWQKLWSAQVNFKYQFASMVATFTLGFLVANNYGGNEPTEINGHPNSALLAFAEKDDFQITDMQLKQVDSQSGDIEVVYSLASRTSLGGNISDQQIQKLLATTIQNDVSDSTRLDLVDLLKDYSNTQSVRKALSHTLLNDPNPGVRMVAAESLAKLSHDEGVREVLRSALQSDVNPGVRVEAFQALIQHMEDKETIELLKQHSANDSNLFIRNQVKKLLEQEPKETQI